MTLPSTMQTLSNQERQAQRWRRLTTFAVAAGIAATDSAAESLATPYAISALPLRLADAGLDAVKTENLYTFDGVRGYSQAQGE